MQPFSRNYIYVDAHSGSVIHSTNVVHNALGTADIRFSGRQEISTSPASFGSNGFVLHDKDRNIHTVRYTSMSETGVLGTDYIDNDNNWTSQEWHNSTNDDAALEAHWGASQTYDFYLNKFGRQGFNNNNGLLRNVVNVTSLYNNAGWTQEEGILYGVIYENGSPVVCLDLIGHEYTHAVIDNTSNLENEKESGALDEGFSDIFGICVENHTKSQNGEKIWTMGEDLNYGLLVRNIKSPNCKYYKGKGWINTTSSNDKGGIHTNCGVLTYWFYLLVNGGSGVNESNKSYRIHGIGFEKAEKICYNTMTAYLNSTSTFNDARISTLKATKAMYGEYSDEYIAVMDAWMAVGVGEGYVCDISGPTLISEKSTATYTVTNAPIDAEFSLGGLELISFNGKELVVKATNTARAYINVCSKSGVVLSNLALWVGAPIVSSVYYDSKDKHLIASFFGGDPKVSSASWSVSGGGYTFYPYTHFVPYQQSGTVSVSVSATNACGTGPTYSCSVTLGNSLRSISQSADTRTFSILSGFQDGTTIKDINTERIRYKVVNIRTGAIVEQGDIKEGGTLVLSKEPIGLYILELSDKNGISSTFKISIK